MKAHLLFDRAWQWLTHPQHRAPRHRLVLFVTVVLAIVISVFALIPVTLPPGAPGSDKLHHLVAFGALSLPCAVLFPRALIVVLPGAVLLGGMIELIQPSVGRHRELADFVADIVGAA